METFFSHRLKCHLLCNNIMMGRWKLFKCFMRNVTTLRPPKSKHLFIRMPLSTQDIFIKNCWAACFSAAIISFGSHELLRSRFFARSLFGIHLEKVFTFPRSLRQQFFMQDQIVHNRICVRRYKLAAEAAAAEIMPSATMWIMISLRTKKWNKTAKLFPANKAISLRSANAEDVSCRTGE